MVIRGSGFALLALLSFVSSCIRPEPDCVQEPQQLQKIFVGFYLQDSASYYHSAIDTTFSSVYAAGYAAEMKGRRVDRKFYLPVPAGGGEVRYVFEQGTQRDTLALEVQLELDFEDTYCQPVVRISGMKLLPEFTSYPSELIEAHAAYHNEASIRIYLP